MHTHTDAYTTMIQIVSADQVADYLRETWESRDYYEEWIGRWKWEWWGVGHPMPTYEERVEYVNAMMELLEKRKKKKEQRMLAKKKAEEVREMKAKVKGKGKGKAKGKGKSPEPTRSNISSALPGPPPPPSAMSRPLQVAVASELLTVGCLSKSSGSSYWSDRWLDS